MGALPPLRVSRLHGGPIAADPNRFHAPGVTGITSQMGGPYSRIDQLESSATAAGGNPAKQGAGKASAPPAPPFIFGKVSGLDAVLGHRVEQRTTQNCADHPVITRQEAESV